MSLSAPSRRLPIRGILRPHYHQRRTALFGSSGGKKDDDEPQSNPVLDEYRRQNPESNSKGQQGQQRPRREDLPEGMYQPGDITASSIFKDSGPSSRQRPKQQGAAAPSLEVGGIPRNPNIMARVLDPDPKNRERWERKKVIQMVRRGGRMTKEQMIKRTEREHWAKSHNMKTSVKKLGMLARQLSGKPLDEAIVQMRFSKKKVAQEVLKQLEAARDEAVVMRGMGLGKVGDAATAAVEGSPSLASDRSALQTTGTNPAGALEIQLKDGKRHKVEDRSRIYIDQAWVGRGPYGKLPDYRARGQVNMMRTPWTHMSVVLKEEATRVREWEEREAKRLKRLREKVWRHLPDRPIQIQRQWYSW